MQDSRKRKELPFTKIPVCLLQATHHLRAARILIESYRRSKAERHMDFSQYFMDFESHNNMAQHTISELLVIEYEEHYFFTDSITQP